MILPVIITVLPSRRLSLSHFTFHLMYFLKMKMTSKTNETTIGTMTIAGDTVCPLSFEFISVRVGGSELGILEFPPLDPDGEARGILVLFFIAKVFVVVIYVKFP